MHFQVPTQGFNEQVFQHAVEPDADGEIHVELKNPKLGLGPRWTYSPEELPHLYEWKMMGQGTYVLGVEPANCLGMHGRADARANGQLIFLEPGESREYHLELEVVKYP